MTTRHSTCSVLPETRRGGAGAYPEHLARTWMLASGEELLLRPIRHDDDAREEAFVRALSRESGYQRMLSAIKITREWIERMVHVDYRCHMAFAVTSVKEGVEQFVGVGRYVVDATKPTAEFALVIADARQRQGEGSGRRGSRRHRFCHQPRHVVARLLARLQR